MQILPNSHFIIKIGCAAVLLVTPVLAATTHSASVPAKSNVSATTLTRQTISLAGAHKAIKAAKDEAARNGWVICVAVVDAAGDLVALEKLDGAIAISPAVAQAKARTAALLQSPSGDFEKFINNGKPSFLSTPGVTPLEGGVPIIVNNQVVGAVGISGSNGPGDSQVANVAATAVSH